LALAVVDQFFNKGTLVREHDDQLNEGIISISYYFDYLCDLFRRVHLKCKKLAIFQHIAHPKLFFIIGQNAENISGS
jgi:hypothetical protein